MATLLVEIEVPDLVVERWDPARIRSIIENAVGRAYAHDVRREVEARPLARWRANGSKARA